MFMMFWRITIGIFWILRKITVGDWDKEVGQVVQSEVVVGLQVAGCRL